MTGSGRIDLQRVVMAVLFLVGTAGLVHGHSYNGHMKLTPIAVQLAKGQTPAFFTDGAPLITECCVEPDLWRTPTPTGELRRVEGSEHFMDLELLEGNPIPESREEFYSWCKSKQLSPGKVGTLPYSLAEWTDRLTVAFAEHRQWPNDKNIQAKCLVFAGILSHYAEDACQPLHATKHYDGRVKEDGSSPRTGIHLKTDLLAEKFNDPNIGVDKSQVVPFDNLRQGIAARLARSNSEVDKVFELEQSIPSGDSPLTPGSPAYTLARQMVQEASLFTAQLYATAWHDSASVKIEKYYQPATSVSADGGKNGTRTTVPSGSDNSGQPRK